MIFYNKPLYIFFLIYSKPKRVEFSKNILIVSRFQNFAKQKVVYSTIIEQKKTAVVQRMGFAFSFWPILYLLLYWSSQVTMRLFIYYGSRYSAIYE